MSYSKKFRASPDVRLSDWSPSDTNGQNRSRAEERVRKNLDFLFEQQQILYAENKRALLIILQGMDASGKDGVIRHVMRGFNPQGCSVTSFKAPSDEERDHDFLWRIHRAVPAKGDVGIFNRSHYEDVLVVRVKELVPKSVWSRRYDQINRFEEMLTANDVTVVKIFLHISPGEQRERLEKRLDDPLKNWKFNAQDLAERRNWKEYMEAYEAVLRKCSTKAAPWHIVPADKKWFRNLVVSEIIRETFVEMSPRLPKPAADLKKLRVV